MKAHKTALITGITGQDGSYLAELLLGKGYVVHGIIRRSSSFNTARIDHLMGATDLQLHYGDLTDLHSLERVLRLTRPNEVGRNMEVYHLGAQSHVQVSFHNPIYSCDVDAMGTLRLLEAILQICPQARVYHASTSEMFGNSPAPQSESTPFNPQSPYACAKVMSHHLAQHYRERGMWVATGILFNHESPRRGETFLTRKITRAATRIKMGLQDELRLGNLQARRDWGWAPDYVRAMWMILQHEEPDDFVVATGVSRTVLDVVERAFEQVGLGWRGYVIEDPVHLRPTEVDDLCGSPWKAADTLGWKPTVGFEEMIDRMVLKDLRMAQREKLLQDAGHDKLDI